jgi:hypothetical protein
MSGHTWQHMISTENQIARRLKTTAKAVGWAIEDLGIEPDRLVGKAPLYNEEAVRLIAAELDGQKK